MDKLHYCVFRICVTYLWQSSISDFEIVIFSWLNISITLSSSRLSWTNEGIPWLFTLILLVYYSNLFSTISISDGLFSRCWTFCCSLNFSSLIASVTESLILMILSFSSFVIMSLTCLWKFSPIALRRLLMTSNFVSMEAYRSANDELTSFFKSCSSCLTSLSLVLWELLAIFP